MDLCDFSLPLAAGFGGPKDVLWWSQSQGE